MAGFPIPQKLRALPGGTVSVGGGIAILGASAYLFQVLAGRVLGDAKYAPLGVLWILVFLLGPAFLYPIEQEVSRAIAARRALKQGVGPVVRKATLFVGCLLVALLVLMGAAYAPLQRLFDDQWLLLVGLMSSVVAYAAAYLVRGLFAGNARLHAYGALLAGEGLVRLVAAGIMAAAGVKSPGLYGVAVGAAPLVSALVLIGIRRDRKQLSDPGPPAQWGELTASLANLVVASLFSQLLVNAAPIIVKYQATGAEVARAGAFAKAVLITRIPLFLFQAVQAILLPRLTHLATLGDHGGFRRAFRFVMLLVGALGLIGTLASGALAGHLLQWFGSAEGIPRLDMTLLGAGNAAFLLSITASQALVALRRQVDTVWGWASGLVIFVGFCFKPGSTLMTVEIALLIGSVVSAVVMTCLVGVRVRHIEASTRPELDAPPVEL